ncbi:homeobox and C2H2 transcription factor, putative [Trichophyton verrucosum HKI 0517]|uniref:Homeobox and C2H2 transcription factor, putative n=1 Tax=Trichophyton verrucosum (strain HKI 0517) TaxID=663202 RepID=D4D1L4_TRIVH|nr:homeobox and C2H2 transcription factor, putative [Trichophyton verrucosum HKI 0517]EFE44279.1 homeobox and C2H2 transcription factor, putative [Trichophyton verrucosum HKI 0517]
MEYFDFDEAARQNGDIFRYTEVADQDRCDPILAGFDNAAPPNTTPSFSQPSDAQQPSSLDGAYPMHRVKDPCYFCRCMGLDCVVAQRGVMQNACTCCIALYRKCSFTRPLSKENHIDTQQSESEASSAKGPPSPSQPPNPGNISNLPKDIEQQPRKSGVRFSLKAVKVLKSWISEHASHPYPTDAEKDELKEKTGLNRSQISSWLANARRRGKVRPPPRCTSPYPGAVTIPGKRLPPGVDISELNPLERWKHSPPENEAASARDIIQAMATSSFISHLESDFPHLKSHSRHTDSSNDDSYSNKLTAHSISGYSADTNKSSLSEMSFASAFSHRSRGSWNSTENRERRRRRHKSAAAPNPFQKSRVARIFQCTFCTDSFPTKYDWQRHEKSLHLALDKWTCAPNGGIITNSSGELVCAFCNHPNPDEDHLETHNFSTCQEKSVQERTFYRKDHLNQHLRLMHGVKLAPWMDAWKSTTTKIKSRCGFCSATFNTWKERVDHLAAHFKAGTEISQWRGDWGFESHIEECVENSMPPYLIGQERNTLDPWVASKAFNLAKYGRNFSKEHKVAPSEDTEMSALGMPFRTDASCFRRLEKELSAYIARLFDEGITPTDKLLQSKARLIVYGSDDTWNQTCADNPIWLKVLKRNNGLEDSSDTEDIKLEDLGMQPPFAADGGLRQAPAHSSRPRQALSGTLSPPSGFESTTASNPASIADSTRNNSDFCFKGGGGSRSSAHNYTPSPGSHSPHNLNFPSPMSVHPHGVNNESIAVDPLLEMGFDAEFLQQLNDGYGDLGRVIDGLELQGLGYTGATLHNGTFNVQKNNNNNNNTYDNVSTTDSAPVTPHSGIAMTSPEALYTVVSSGGSVEPVYIPGAFDSLSYNFQQTTDGYRGG